MGIDIRALVANEGVEPPAETPAQQTSVARLQLVKPSAGTSTAAVPETSVMPRVLTVDSAVESLRRIEQVTPDCSLAAYKSAFATAGLDVPADWALDYLRKRMVAPGIAARRGYTSGDGALPNPPHGLGKWTQSQQEWAISGGGRAWLLIPWLDAAGQVVGWQCRWEQPRIEITETDSSGKPVADRKHKFDFPAGRDQTSMERLVDGMHISGAAVAAIIESPVRADSLASIAPGALSAVAVGGITMAYEGKSNTNNPSDLLPRISPDVLRTIGGVKDRHVLWIPDLDHLTNPNCNQATQATVETLLVAGAAWAGVVHVPDKVTHPVSSRDYRLDDGAGLDDLAAAMAEVRPGEQWLGGLLADAMEGREYIRRWRQYRDDDDAAAQRLADWAVAAGTSLHVTDPTSKVGEWWGWVGRHWQVDGSDKTITRLAREAAGTALGSRKDDSERLRSKQRSRGAIASAVALAVSDPRIARDRSMLEPLDVALLLPQANGVVDLATGDLLDHDPSRKFVASGNVRYRGRDYRHPVWEAHVAGFFVRPTAEGGWVHDPELEGLAQELLGVALMGRTCDAFSLWLGEGGCGIGTTLSACAEVVGGYKTAVKARDITGQGNQFAMSQTIWRRLGITGEVSAEDRLAGSDVKSAAQDGEDQDRERKGKDSRDIRNTCSLLIPGNSLMGISIADGDNNGVKRRARILRFARVIPETERDGGITERLRQPDVQSAILAWMVRGAMRVIARNLTVTRTEASDLLVQEWLDGRDRLTRFLAERVELVPATEVDRAAVRLTDRALYQAYEVWAEREGIDPQHRTRRYGFRERVGKIWGKPTRMNTGEAYWTARRLRY